MRNNTLQAKQTLQNDIANMLMEFEREHNVSIHTADIYPDAHSNTLEVYIDAPFRCEFYLTCGMSSNTARTCNRGGGNYCGMYRKLKSSQ